MGEDYEHDDFFSPGFLDNSFCDITLFNIQKENSLIFILKLWLDFFPSTLSIIGF